MLPEAPRPSRVARHTYPPERDQRPLVVRIGLLLVVMAIELVVLLAIVAYVFERAIRWCCL